MPGPYDSFECTREEIDFKTGFLSPTRQSCDLSEASVVCTPSFLQELICLSSSLRFSCAAQGKLIAEDLPLPAV
jgi:hypothetical protein